MLVAPRADLLHSGCTPSVLSGASPRRWMASSAYVKVGWRDERALRWPRRRSLFPAKHTWREDRRADSGRKTLSAILLALFARDAGSDVPDDLRHGVVASARRSDYECAARIRMAEAIGSTYRIPTSIRGSRFLFCLISSGWRSGGRRDVRPRSRYP